jgi:hypothetical protein
MPGVRQVTRNSHKNQIAPMANVGVMDARKTQEALVFKRSGVLKNLRRVMRGQGGLDFDVSKHVLSEAASDRLNNKWVEEIYEPMERKLDKLHRQGVRCADGSRIRQFSAKPFRAGQTRAVVQAGSYPVRTYTTRPTSCMYHGHSLIF